MSNLHTSLDEILQREYEAMTPKEREVKDSEGARWILYLQLDGYASHIVDFYNPRTKVDQEALTADLEKILELVDRIKVDRVLKPLLLALAANSREELKTRITILYDNAITAPKDNREPLAMLVGTLVILGKAARGR